MLGRKDYTQEEVDAAKAAVAEQVATYRRAIGAKKGAGQPFEGAFANAVLLALDRRFVHRIRSVSGKDGNALNELELLVESLMDNGGVLRVNNVIKYVPESSVLGLKPGDEIRLTVDEVERFAEAYFEALEARFR